MKYSELYLHQLFNKCFLRGDNFVIDAYNYKRRPFIKIWFYVTKLFACQK